MLPPINSGKKTISICVLGYGRTVVYFAKLCFSQVLLSRRKPKSAKSDRVFRDYIFVRVALIGDSTLTAQTSARFFVVFVLSDFPLAKLL
jgi:hypothetical protein